MEIVKDVAAVIGLISAAIGLLVTIIKPIRVWIINSIVSKSEDKQLNKDVQTLLVDVKVLLETNKKLNERIERLENHVLENESDRLKSELAEYYNRCCRGMQIFPEEFLRVEEVYHKYHDVLHLNHIGTNMYDVIASYYKSQTFLKESCNHNHN